MRRDSETDLFRVLEYAISREYIRFTDIQALLGISPTYLNRYYLGSESDNSWLKHEYLEKLQYNPSSRKLVTKRGRNAYGVTGKGRLRYFQLLHRPSNWPRIFFSSLIEYYATMGYVSATLRDFTDTPLHDFVLLCWKEGTNNCLVVNSSFGMQFMWNKFEDSLWMHASQADAKLLSNPPPLPPGTIPEKMGSLGVIRIMTFEETEMRQLKVEPLCLLVSRLYKTGNLSRTRIRKIVGDWLADVRSIKVEGRAPYSISPMLSGSEYFL